MPVPMVVVMGRLGRRPTARRIVRHEDVEHRATGAGVDDAVIGPRRCQHRLLGPDVESLRSDLDLDPTFDD